jgi:adenine deaminase
MEVAMDRYLSQVAMGKEPASLVITNGQLVNVNSGEIYPGGVAVAGDKIAATGDVAYCIGAKTQIINADGMYITPGFIDGHIHPESTNLNMSRFADIVLCHGTTSVFTDLHEIGVVGGIEAIHSALDEGTKTKLKYYWVVPSHIPFSPELETSGSIINADIIKETIICKEAVGLSEVISMYVTMEYPDLMSSIDMTKQQRKIVCGHGPDTSGPLWNAFVAAGVSNDHEALSAEDILLRVRSGVYAQLRHSLVVPALPQMITAVKDKGIDTRMISLVTDDTTAIMLVKEGHMDYLARLALKHGVDFITTIQMITLNAAQTFSKESEIGSLSPGRYADINIVKGPEDFTVLKTIANGELVAENLRPVKPASLPEHSPIFYNTFHIQKPAVASDMVINSKYSANSARLHVMRTLPWIPITEGYEADLPVKDGYIAADITQDLLHIAVIERHHQTGNIGKAFLGGMGLKRGAMASSIGHDHHNIVVIGVEPEDMAVAANRIVELQGGMVLVEKGRIIEEIALPLLGLLNDMDAWTLAEKRSRLLDKAGEMGCIVSDAFMFLSFITLAAIPAFAITDKGYIDVINQKVIDPVLKYNMETA